MDSLSEEKCGSVWAGVIRKAHWNGFDVGHRDVSFHLEENGNRTKRD